MFLYKQLEDKNNAQEAINEYVSKMNSARAASRKPSRRADNTILEKAKAQGYTIIKTAQDLQNMKNNLSGKYILMNDIDLSDSVEKIFVNSNTLENPIDVLYYWTMNRYSSTFVRGSDTSGYLFYVSPSISYGVRPVIFLKNNLEFISGKGTAEAPYELQ